MTEPSGTTFFSHEIPPPSLAQTRKKKKKTKSRRKIDQLNMHQVERERIIRCGTI